MTTQGKWNLIGLFLLPVAVVIAAAIATANGVWNATSEVYIFLFQMNFGVMLLAAFFSWLLLRKAEGGRARWFAVLPTVGPAIYGAVWYLWRSVFPAAVAPGAEYIGAVQYLAIAILVLTVLVLLLRVTGIVSRTA
jgi:hypothetical protein